MSEQGPESRIGETESPHEINPEKERGLTEAAKAVCARLEQIVISLRDTLADQDTDMMAKIKSFVSKAKEIWPENDGHRIKPTFDLSKLVPGYQNLSLKFEFYNADYSGELGRVEGREGGELVLGLNKLLTAETLEEFNDALQRMFETVYHETEHLAYPGEDLADESTEAILRYYANPGEIRAHSKAYAYRYYQKFPGEGFDLEKMRSIATSSKDKMFFVSFADSQHEKYRNVADQVAKIHDGMIRSTTRFVEYFNA